MNEKELLVINRLKTVLEEQRVTQSELARSINKTPQAVYNWLNNGKLGIDSARLISDRYNYSVNWLIGSASNNEKYNDVAVIENKDYSDSYIGIDVYDIKLSAGNGQGCAVEWIPRKSSKPLLFEHGWFKHKSISPESCKAMYVRGQSMYPVLKDWDMVIINIDDTEIIDGEIYALIYKENFYIKQVVRSGDGVELISFNSEYKPIRIEYDQLQDLKVIGRQIWRGG
ncbi:XRE family transcriptional regulator [Gallibacterium anatis]|uniref:Transcriptional regulator n=1 Tax=Gallibacterium anatis TaxID=750 RepID=A0A0A2XGJ6_9PAST|nr:XRE family transcriptional regulator [Gallibacterium anatis]KGQ29755.1 transcriptional regulator [Gallibacterium anatis]